MPTQHLLRLTKGRPLTEALLASTEGRDSNPRRRETGVTTFKKKVAALVHSATSPILRIRYSPECVKYVFCELRRHGVLRTSQQRINFTQYESDVLCPRSILLVWRIFRGA